MVPSVAQQPILPQYSQFRRVRKLKESKASTSGEVNLLSEEIDPSVVRSRMIVIVDFVNSRWSPLGRLDKHKVNQT